MEKQKIAIVLVAVVLTIVVIAFATGIVQLPQSGGIKTSEQASEAIGDIGSSIEKLGTTISNIESGLK